MIKRTVPLIVTQPASTGELVPVHPPSAWQFRMLKSVIRILTPSHTMVRLESRCVRAIPSGV